MNCKFVLLLLILVQLGTFDLMNCLTKSCTLLSPDRPTQVISPSHPVPPVRTRIGVPFLPTMSFGIEWILGIIPNMLTLSVKTTATPC